MNYQPAKNPYSPPDGKFHDESSLPILGPSALGKSPGQVIGTPCSWTVVTPRASDGSAAHTQSRQDPFTRSQGLETPTRKPRHSIIQPQQMMQIVEGSGQKAVAIPDESSGQQWSLQPALPHEPVRNFILPFRQPLQPNSNTSFSAGPHHSSGEQLASDRFYWPMNSCHVRHGDSSLPLPTADQPGAVHLGHSVTNFSKPVLVSDNVRTARLAAASNSTLVDESDAPSKVALGFSPFYHGDPSLLRNQSAKIPDELNCSLFLVNLPPNLTTHRLIAAVHAMGPTGRIYATHINAPEPDRKHYGCAAKVIFFELAAARAFYDACDRGGFSVDGFSVRVMWNRIKTAQQDHARSTTRVLLIGGRPDFVNPTALTEYFCTKLQFQIDCIITHDDGLAGGTDAVVEYRFGSFRCQAEAAKMALVREHPDVRCFFHCDPCDPGHWKPSKRIPVAPPSHSQRAPQAHSAPHTLSRTRPDIWSYPRLPAVPEDVEDEHLLSPYRHMFTPLAPWGT
ncbi:hypothetical protein Daus18300_009646 [Diaporthe australafricana]|uniref:RRM domain-containing protein n=1 Tax=Diaporthe australafricana TaxID=127596 RepID=A0ABR3WDQ3_9PEZI